MRPYEESPPGILPLLHLQRPAHRFINPSDTQFWDNFYAADITSNERVSKVWTLLSCSSKIAVARTFRGIEAQTFIDFLDPVSNSCAPYSNNSGL